MTDRLLSTSRASADMAREPIRQALEESEAAIRQLLGLGVRFTLKSTADLWPCSVHGEDLEAALLNLAANAKYAMPGVGTFDIEASNLLIASRTDSIELEAGEYVTLTVSDSGNGMSEETLSRVRGTAFYTTKPKGEGTGLGLAQVREFVEQEGGKMFISSTPNVGTTLRLCFPVSSALRSSY